MWKSLRELTKTEEDLLTTWHGVVAVAEKERRERGFYEPEAAKGRRGFLKKVRGRESGEGGG